MAEDTREADQTRKQNRNVIVGLVVAFAVIFLVLGVVVYWKNRTPSGAVTGALTGGAGEAAWELSPDICRSRYHDEDADHLDGVSFYGVVLSSSGASSVKLWVLTDPARGDVVRVFTAADEDGAPVDPKTCTEYDVELEETDAAVGGLWGMNGALSLDCENIRGEVTFEGCY